MIAEADTTNITGGDLRNRAWAHGAVGDLDLAFEMWDELYDARDGILIQMQVDARFDPLRGDPRFDDLVRRMNFPE